MSNLHKLLLINVLPDLRRDEYDTLYCLISEVYVDEGKLGNFIKFSI